MQETIITCPRCSFEFPLTDSLASPLVEQTRKTYDKILTEKETEIASQEAVVRQQKAILEEAREKIEGEIEMRLDAERKRIAADEMQKAKTLAASELNQKLAELAELQEVLRLKDAKLAAAQEAQAEILRKKRELEDARREFNLTVETKVQESLSALQAKARDEAEETFRLKVVEKEEQIASMQRQIEALRRKADQGSQQLQGEALELALEELLRSSFPGDLIEPVTKGDFGGDMLQTVVSPTGRVCGTILWETKRTKNWSEGWVSKLRGDQRTAKADFAVIVSDVLPKGVARFELIRWRLGN